MPALTSLGTQGYLRGRVRIRGGKYLGPAKVARCGLRICPEREHYLSSANPSNYLLGAFDDELAEEKGSGQRNGGKEMLEIQLAAGMFCTSGGPVRGFLLTLSRAITILQ